MQITSIIKIGKFSTYPKRQRVTDVEGVRAIKYEYYTKGQIAK